MDCKDVSAFLETYKKGESALSSNREAQEHFKSCKACKEAFDGVLLDADAAVFSKAFLSRKPSRDIAAEVLKALPEPEKEGSGGDEKAPKAGGRTKSSGRLKPVRTGEEKVKPSSGEMKSFKPGSKTAIRRRKPDDTTVFFGENLFQSTDKKTGGFTIKYCEECNERISLADIESGMALTYKDATYCPKCKGKVAEFIEADGGSAEPDERKATRVARPVQARPSGVARGSGKKPMNLPLVGGGIIGVALVLIVALVVIMNSGGKPSPESSKAGSQKGQDSSRKTPEGRDETSGKKEAKNDAEANVEDPKKSRQEEEMIKIREKERKEKEEKDRKIAEVDKLIDETCAKSTSLIDEKKFKDALDLCSEVLQKMEGMEPTEVQKKKLESQLSSVKSNWRSAAFRKIQEIKDMADKYESQREYEKALKVLDEFPEDWKGVEDPDGSFERALYDLTGLKRTINYRWEAYKKGQIEEQKKKFHIGIAAGEEHEAFSSEDSLRANWSGRGTINYDKAEKIVTVTTSDANAPAILFATFKNKDAWLDYELSFEYKSDCGLLLHYRIKPGTKGQAARLDVQNAWKKVRFVLSGLSAQMFVDEEKVDGIVDLHPGYFAFQPFSTGSIQLRNLKIKVMKLEEK